eukprot:8355-Heterococcus_DN1.PRE.1
MAGTALDTSHYLQEVAEQAIAVTDAAVGPYSSAAAARELQTNAPAGVAVPCYPIGTAGVQTAEIGTFGTSGSKPLCVDTPAAAEEGTTVEAVNSEPTDQSAAANSARSQEQ